VLAGIYRSTDRLSHSFWRYHEPEAFADTDPTALDEFGNTIEDIYSLVDEQANADRRAELTNVLSSVMIEGTDIRAFRVDNVDKSGTGDDYVEVDAAKELLDLIPQNPNVVTPDGRSVKTTDFLTASEWSGAHDFDGIIVVSGEPFTKGGSIEGAGILDITPTALAALGLPVANDMDGVPLVGTMTSDFLSAHPITAIETYESEKREKQEHGSMETMSEDLKERLRSIGYIE
jgi:hypothetical protein